MTQTAFEKLVEEKSFVEKHNGHEIVFLEDDRQGGYTCWLKEYPEVISEGETIQEAAENVINVYKDMKDRLPLMRPNPFLNF
jgi:predicted RNase H-like HicB family nuclease